MADAFDNGTYATNVNPADMADDSNQSEIEKVGEMYSFKGKNDKKKNRAG